MKRIIFLIWTSLFMCSAWAQEVEVTVYNQNFALVKDQRYFDLTKGINKVQFNDVAKLIEPTSVHFVSLTDPASSVILEQNYEYDLMSSDKLLSKYIDKNIKIVTGDERSYDGMLLSYDNANVVISAADGLSMITRPDNIRQISFEKIPEGLITKPTLVWELESTKDGRQLTEVSYLTSGITWNCEYVTVLDATDKNIDLDGWVSIDNRSGATYKDAKLKLIAGEVKRAQGKSYDRNVVMMEARAAAPSQFEEKAFFEYHLYTLQRKSTLKDNQTKQISLLNARGVPIKKEFIFDPSAGKWSYQYYSDNETIKENVRVELELKNSKENNLGMPLPKGKVKVYKKDTDGSLQFIGEDAIEHTPKDEKVRLYIGDAFDIVGERERLDFKQEYRSATETYEISLRNHKETDAEVIVREKLSRYTNWNIVESSLKGEKKDASTMDFKVIVPKNGEQKITYKVKYRW
ncbi:MAG: DUF4139 domain-containing protein [Candidatus Omnitrophica bacterium]|nr:DUF4139 domain-containing protein [Candidatus Omnitrophota bacterium]